MKTETYDKDWHAAHKDDPNIKEARRQASRRRYERLKNDPDYKSAQHASGKKWRQQNKEVSLTRRYEYYEKYPEYGWLDTVKRRAKKLNLPYNLTVEYIRSITPEVCPVFGFPLVRSKGTNGIADNAPTIDRIIPQLGYVVGNVIVVSKLANQIKSSATPDQILKVGKFYEELFRSRS